MKIKSDIPENVENVENADDGEIDWKDESGLIAFIELEKRYKIRKNVQEDLKKVEDFSIEDWILILIHSNDNSLRKTLLANLLLIFSERTGVNFSNCQHYFACPEVIENALNNLVNKGRLELEIGRDSQDIIFKNYNIKDRFWVRNLYLLIPETIKKVLLELKEEFKEKSVNEIVNYVTDAYPEYFARL